MALLAWLNRDDSGFLDPDLALGAGPLEGAARCSADSNGVVSRGAIDVDEFLGARGKSGLLNIDACPDPEGRDPRACGALEFGNDGVAGSLRLILKDMLHLPGCSEAGAHGKNHDAL